MKNMERIRWRCRRGLLELDIVLGRFMEQHYSTLDEPQQIAFDEMLDLPDTELWDWVSGRVSPQSGMDRHAIKVLALLKA